MRSIAIVILGFLALASPAFASDPLDVGMVQLLATPEKFDGKLVRVVGFLSLEFEGVGACVHEERLPMINLLSGELTALNRLEVMAEDAPRAREILAEGESRANRDL